MPHSRSRSPPPRHSHRERERSPRYEGARHKSHRSKDPDYEDRRDSRRDNKGRDDRRYRRAHEHSPRYSRREHKEGEPEEIENRLIRRPKTGSRSRSASPVVDKTKPNFKPSGLLAATTNTVTHEGGKTTLLKYNEPPEARKPTQSWRLYVFKGNDETDVFHISRQSAYLVGRDKLVADILIEHPSCSKQHAALQYRSISSRDEFGSVKTTIKPFIIDLESTNGTHVNNEEIPAARYYELRSGDVIKFGLSTREYVVLMDPDS